MPKAEGCAPRKGYLKGLKARNLREMRRNKNGSVFRFQGLQVLG
jgi:hypothetical protein